MLGKIEINKEIPSNEAGFSLIDVLLGLSFFAIAFLGLTALQISTINADASSRKGFEAASVAEQQVETILAMPYASVVSTGPTPVNNIYTVSWTVGTPGVFTKPVQLDVTWKSGKEQRKFTLNFVKRK